MTEVKKAAPMSRLACALLALVMAIGICVPTAAFAATATYTGNDAGTGTITIEKAQENETYSLYKMLNLSYDESTDSYAYTVADGWMNFFTGEGAGAEYFDVDVNGYVTIKEGVTLESDSSEMATLAKAALAYAEKAELDPMLTVKADSDGATFEGLPFGWYLVGTTLGSLCSIDTVNQEVTVNEKNPTPTAEKEVYNESTDDGYTKKDTAEIGDTLTFEVFLQDVAHSSNLCVHDEMSKGITFTIGSVEVYVGYPDSTEDLFNDTTTVWTEVSDDYWAEIDQCDDDDCDFELTFVDSWLDGLNDGAVIKVVYKGVLNEDAEETGTFWDAEHNSLHLTYGAGSFSTTVKTTTDTVGFELKKINDSNVLLDGAKFTLYHDSDHEDPVYFVVESDGTYRVATSEDESGATTTIVAGDVSIKGLHEGTYYLVETEAPEGYNMLTSDVVIAITAIYDEASGEVTGETITVNGEAIDGNEVDVVNNAGTELPGTGGMGTTIFYIVGGILVVGAVVLLVTRRRMSHSE